MSETETIERIRIIVAEHGPCGAARLLGASREAITRLVAGFPVREGTRALVRERLSKLVA